MICFSEIAKARLHTPEGWYCNDCGKENLNADDCGWWYSGKPYTAKCENCAPPPCGER